MKNRRYLKIILVSGAVALLIVFAATLLVKPRVRDKIEAALKENNSAYIVTADKVKTSIIPAGIELENIKIRSKEDFSGIIDLNGVIGSIKIRGINLVKTIFRKDINIRKITISECIFAGKITSPGDTFIPVILPVNMHIGNIFFDRIDLSVNNSNNAASFLLKDGILSLSDVQIKKQDTLSSEIINIFDFEAGELVLVSSDSMYSYKSGGIRYRSLSNNLVIDSISIQANFTDYDFTSRYEFQKNRIEAFFSEISAIDFDLKGYLRSGNIRSSYIEVRKMDMSIFRDNRKEFHHLLKPAFQDIIYNYQSEIQIDSISVPGGNVIYTEHAKDANEPGYLSFNGINARIYKITNDPIYKTDTGFLEIKGDALLMGKSKFTVYLKGRIYDPVNTFSLYGTLSAMEAGELNPYLEKKAFVYVTSGTIDGMNLSFIANNTKASGKMTLLYHGLDLAVKNKRTDDTIAFRERFISFLVNRKVMESNPLDGDEVREGVIDYEMDPERFLLHYCGKSIMSGLRSSLLKSK